MVLSKDGKTEIISVEEKRYKDYINQFEEANKSFEMQIELNNVLIKYLQEKIKKCT